ncbi:molybdopterin-guanine dinucleotide biosynthesis protein A [Kineococcus xinjiangensis]|uniref:Molybdopterin-guanine dinucleotide biosynthesis protein A n=1 Tax=Kineococcus xinjiangensis TaxID=512762 RepID=A0A2S6IFZ9_9ACTN|nr:molybdopterin-guanine dinucleotide biosynthesis protein A [Kineococcus xinjiangensis]
MDPGSTAVVVLAGGAARRFTARADGPESDHDKVCALLAGRPLLDHLLDGLPPEVPVVVVGPARATCRPVTTVREDPPGGGPVAGLAAAVTALPAGTATVVLLGGDHPFAAAAVPRLLAALAGSPAAACAAGVDPQGRRQPLLSAHRLPALRARLAGAPAAGRRLREVLAGPEVAVPVTAEEVLDVDTAEDLDEARRLHGRRQGPGAGAG